MSDQQNNNKIFERTKRPTTVAGALGTLMRIFGVRASDADLSARWDEIMGSDISNISTVIAIKKQRNDKFNIILRPKNPAFALQLSYMSDEIIKRANKYFGYNAVDKISFRK